MAGTLRKGELPLDLNKRVFNIHEAAAFYGICERTMYKKVRKKEVPGKKVGGVWRFSREALEQALSP